MVAVTLYCRRKPLTTLRPSEREGPLRSTRICYPKERSRPTLELPEVECKEG